MLHLMIVIERIQIDVDDNGMPVLSTGLVFCVPDVLFQSQAEFIKDKNQNPAKYKARRYGIWDDSRPIFDLVEPPKQLTMKIVEPEERP